MSKFNRKDVPTVGPRSAVSTVEPEERVSTGEGYLGYKRTAKSELFLLAASFMGGDDNFYEKESDRYRRLINLIRTEEVYGDLEWLYKFVNWLRTEANMRTVSGVIAAEAVHMRISNGMTDPIQVLYHGDHTSVPYTLSNRFLVNIACLRADEPAEIMAYWLAKHGKQMPWPIRNGIADAAVRLYTEKSFLKYGSQTSAAVTMRDVIRMCHPKPKADWQSALFEYIVGDYPVPPRNLSTLAARSDFHAVPRDERIAALSSLSTLIRDADVTWEVLSEWYPGGMNKDAWQAVIPNMGVMALIRNLRNFDQAGIGRDAVRFVQDKIADPETVANSRQLPFRWYNAYRAVESVRWADALDQALTYSVVNIPKLRGRTLVLVDMSGSMIGGRVSRQSNINYADVASLFGAAWKLRNPDGVDLWQFGSDYQHIAGYRNPQGQGFIDRKGVPFSTYEPWQGCAKRIEFDGRGGSVLKAMEKFHDMGGTEIHKAIEQTMTNEHDRLVLITDEQAWAYRSDNLPVPPGKDVYIWNLAGYEAGVSGVGKYRRHGFGGLSDSAFKIIPILEAGRSGGWPWEVQQ